MIKWITDSTHPMYCDVKTESCRLLIMFQVSTQVTTLTTLRRQCNELKCIITESNEHHFTVNNTS